MTRLEEVGLKLNSSKCHFACEEVEYLGHVITPKSLKPNPRLVVAVQDLPVPSSIPDVHRFLGLPNMGSSFRSLQRYTLYQLTRNGATFSWSDDCCLASKASEHD